MAVEQRRLAIVTSLGKKYSGMVDVPSSAFRTTDLLNSANLFWRNPNEKVYDNALMMYEARLFLDESMVYRKFDRIQIKLSEIFYFYDDIEFIGDEMEKKRAAVMIQNTQEKAQSVNIITKDVASSFYDIKGQFYGLFKKKSKDKFVALTQAEMVEICWKQDRWIKREVKLPFGFIGVSNNHIEAVTIG